MSRPNLRRSLGTKGWVLGSNVVSVVCLSINVLSGMAMQGTRGKAGPWDASPARSSRAQSCSPLQYRAGEPFKLSACRGKHGTVATHTAVCCYPAALPPWPGPGTGCMYTPWGTFEDTCKTVPLGEWREAKDEFMHRRPLQYSGPRPDTPLRKSPDDRLLESRGAPSSVSLCRSISASLLLRDHVYSTLQTPSRAPSSQRSARCRFPAWPVPKHRPLSRRFSIAQLPNRPIPYHPRPGVTHASRSLARSDTCKLVRPSVRPSTAWRCSRFPPPPDRKGRPDPSTAQERACCFKHAKEGDTPLCLSAQ